MSTDGSSRETDERAADTLDVALHWVTRYAITATRAGASSDQLETAVRRGLLIARETGERATSP